jgi:thiamine-phosphate pyrophosphorylase
MNPIDLRLYGLVDPDRAKGRDLGDLARDMAAGGCTILQYRDKHSGAREMIERARSIIDALSDTRVPLLVNDRVDVALAAGADGVHVGQEDMSVRDARRLLGPHAIIGLTLKTAEQADAIADLPLDYACIGGVFATTSKDNKDAPVGLDGLARILARGRAASRVPLGAIAGIDLANAARVIGAGADGVAIMSAITMQDDPRQASKALRRVVDEALAARGAL